MPQPLDDGALAMKCDARLSVRDAEAIGIESLRQMLAVDGNALPCSITISAVIDGSAAVYLT